MPATKFHMPVVKLTVFRNSLEAWEKMRYAGKEDLVVRHLKIDDATLSALEASARDVVRYGMGLKRTVRPSEMAETLDRLSNALARASLTMGQIGSEGMLMVACHMGVPGDVDHHDPVRYAVELSRLVRAAKAAAKSAAAEAKPSRKGGRTPDGRLESTISLLLDYFVLYLGLKPVAVVKGTKVSNLELAKQFVHEALKIYGGTDKTGKPRWSKPSIDQAFKQAHGQIDWRTYQSGKWPKRDSNDLTPDENTIF